MDEVCAYDMTYSISEDEKRKLDDFSNNFVLLMLSTGILDIVSQAVRNVFVSYMIKDLSKGFRFFLENSNLVRGLFYEFIVLKIVSPRESGDFGKILSKLPFDNAMLGNGDEEFVIFSEMMQEAFSSKNFRIVFELTVLFKTVYDSKISGSVDPIKCLVYFVKTRQTELYEKFQNSLEVGGFNSEEAGLIIGSIKNFFQEKGRSKL